MRARSVHASRFGDASDPRPACLTAAYVTAQLLARRALVELRGKSHDDRLSAATPELGLPVVALAPSWLKAVAPHRSIAVILLV